MSGSSPTGVQNSSSRATVIAAVRPRRVDPEVLSRFRREAQRLYGINDYLDG
jgi:hypothetical protein